METKEALLKGGPRETVGTVLAAAVEGARHPPHHTITPTSRNWTELYMNCRAAVARGFEQQQRQKCCNEGGPCFHETLDGGSDAVSYTYYRREVVDFL